MTRTKKNQNKYPNSLDREPATRVKDYPRSSDQTMWCHGTNQPLLGQASQSKQNKVQCQCCTVTEPASSMVHPLKAPTLPAIYKCSHEIKSHAHHFFMSILVHKISTRANNFFLGNKNWVKKVNQVFTRLVFLIWIVIDPKSSEGRRRRKVRKRECHRI